MTDELVQWLREQLDDDEQTARKLQNLLPRLQWVADRALRLERAIEWNVPRAAQARIMGALPPEPDGLSWVEAEEMRDTALDPARLLAEVEAKRQLLVVHRPVRRTDFLGSDGAPVGPLVVCHECDANSTDADWPDTPCATLRLLALPYADRPGYRDGWRP